MKLSPGIPLVVLMLLTTGSLAQTLVLSGEVKKVKADDFLFCKTDPEGLLQIDGASQSGPFAPCGVLNLGFDPRPYWFTINIENHSGQQNFVFEIPFAPLDRIDFYYRSDGKWIHQVSGDAVRLDRHSVRHIHPVFTFTVPDKESVQIYFRVHTSSSLQIPVFVWATQEFFQNSVSSHVMSGLFYGAMIIMVLYQLFLFYSTRDKVSLYFVFTLLTVLNVVAFFQGYTFFFIYPDHPAFNFFLARLTAPLFLIFSTLLTRSFLKLSGRNKAVYRLLLIVTAADVLLSFLMVLNPALTNNLHHYAILLHSGISLYAGITGMNPHFRPAAYYLLSWIALLLATVIFSLSNLGFFGEYLSTSSTGLIAGSLLQVFIFSFALGNRWNVLIRENQDARNADIRRGKLEHERLEQEVRIRTEEIEIKSRKLEEVNKVKDKLFSIVSHDIKGPLTSLQLALALTKSDMISQEEFRELATILETRFNQTTEFIQNLLLWASVQLKGNKFAPEQVDLQELTTQTIALLENEIRNKKISVKNEVGPLSAFADMNMLKSILKNLLGNAIKFSPEGQEVRIGATSSEQFVTMSVSDNGVGIPFEHQEKIFSLESVSTPGTLQEKGTGLGLALCREFTERNGGKIWFESEPEKGTTFYFTLPMKASDHGER